MPTNLGGQRQHCGNSKTCDANDAPMTGFALKVSNPYGPHDQCRYNGDKESGVLARPKAMLGTKVQSVKGKPLQDGCNQRGSNDRSLQGKHPPV